jgi:hypothetical protein
MIVFGRGEVLGFFTVPRQRGLWSNLSIQLLRLAPFSCFDLFSAEKVCHLRVSCRVGLDVAAGNRSIDCCSSALLRFRMSLRFTAEHATPQPTLRIVFTA